MALFIDQKLENQTIELDGNEFESCEFINCRMIYRGGDHPRIQRCSFTQCAWQLEDAARRSVLFLRNIYHSGPGGRDLVEQTLRHIRTR